MAEIVMIPVGKLFPHQDNPRRDVGDVSELADSIKVNGILQNLTVVSRYEDTDARAGSAYTVIIGHRRLAAAKLAGLTEVPCVIATMTPAEQVKTMLMENMQRQDLTVYEQAQGFQMMLNLGGTVASVAEETGFSETTVRRRVKLLELDPKEFKKSEERGATLFDYMELDKVDDPKEKNKLLKAIGTADFKAKLEKTLTDQKKAAMFAATEKFLSSFATKAEKVDSGPGCPYEYMTGFNFYRDEERVVPDDAGSREYVFTVTPYGINLYRKRTQQELDEAQKNADEQREKKDQCDAHEAALKEIDARCRKLRHDYIMGLSNAECRRLLPEAAAAMITYLGESNLCLSAEDLQELDINLDIEGEVITVSDVLEAAGKSNAERLLVRLVYLSMEDDRSKYYTSYWLEHSENEELDIIYDFLLLTGYEMSEEEKEYREGTHEIFAGGRDE